jgi:hypothetical protein
MARRKPRARDRSGAISEVQLDGSVTLYGVEDWTQVREDDVVRVVDRTSAGNARPRPAADDDTEADDGRPGTRLLDGEGPIFL